MFENNGDKKLDAVILGRIAVDFNPTTYGLPLKECDTFKKYVGGSSANTAVGMSRLGMKVGMISCVSNDQFGDYCLDFMQNEGVDCTWVSKAKNGECIGLTFTEVLSQAETGLLMYRNCIADQALEVDMVDEDYIKSARLLLISGTALASSPTREAALKAIEFAKKNEVPIVFDIDLRNYTWKNRDEISIYYTLAARNSCIIMGSRDEYDIMDRMLFGSMTDEETAKRWFGEKAEILIIKHGKKGSNAYTKDGKKYDIKVYPVEAQKSTGGGDGYGSAFLASLLKGYDVAKSLDYGTASASMLVASHSCSLEMPDYQKLESFIFEQRKSFGEAVTEDCGRN